MRLIRRKVEWDGGCDPFGCSSASRVDCNRTFGTGGVVSPKPSFSERWGEGGLGWTLGAGGLLAAGLWVGLGLGFDLRNNGMQLMSEGKARERVSRWNKRQENWARVE